MGVVIGIDAKGRVPVDGDALQSFRLERCFSAGDLGKISGLSDATVRRLEAGGNAAHPGTLRRLAKALGVEPRSLASSTTTEGLVGA